jgi:type III pantothenate kinase
VTRLVSIGNTRVVCAVLLPDGRLADVRRVPTGDLGPAAIGAGPGPVHLISVVEEAAKELVTALGRAGTTVVWWGAGREIPVRHPYAPPERPGADRLVAALAAHRRVRRACVVVDAGTAVTVDVAGDDGAFLGGAIAPGLAALATAVGTAAPALAANGSGDPGEYPARSTSAAVTLGVHAAFSGLLRDLHAQACAAFGRLPVVVTGGDAELAARALREAAPTVVPELVLEGLAALARS